MNTEKDNEIPNDQRPKQDPLKQGPAPEDSLKEDSLKEDKVRHMVMGLIAGIFLSVGSLEYYGYIKHSEKADAATVAEFKLLTLKPGYELKTSAKPSGKRAFCSAGYVLIKPDNAKRVAGVLVDAKGRGIVCDQDKL